MLFRFSFVLMEREVPVRLNYALNNCQHHSHKDNDEKVGKEEKMKKKKKKKKKKRRSGSRKWK